MSKSNRKFDLSPRLKFGVGRRLHQNQILKFSSILFLVLAVGLTFNAIRLVLGSRGQTSASASSVTPQVLGASDTRSAADSNEVQFVEYRVQKGDTLFNVSQKFNVNWATLATLNNLKSPFALKPGQTLKVPR